MEDNQLLMIVLAFVVGYMTSGMMKQMCRGRLVEGDEYAICDLEHHTKENLQNHNCHYDPWGQPDMRGSFLVGGLPWIKAGK